MSLLIISLTFFAFAATAFTIPTPDPAAIQPFRATPAATIPAFPEQSDAAGCRLSLPESFFHSVSSACGQSPKKDTFGHGHKGRCCPVLATWLYSAYSATALRGKSAARNATFSAFDMPVLPDDSETCVGEVDSALRARGVVLKRPNETCDVVYCYCGIRLHSLSCPEAFSTTVKGNKLVGDRRVRRLERDCLSSSNGVNAFPGLGACSKCLHSLRQLNNNKKVLDTTKLDERTTKMHNKDCEMMGLTWLLAKNRTAYMHTVSAVIRAIMMSPEGADHHQSCALSGDGMPLAVDSSEFSDQSDSIMLAPLQMSLFIALIPLLYMLSIIL